VSDPPRRSPYVGLVPYGEQDWEYFVGRDRETEVLIANLSAARLTLVYGASGVGKSSVLRAGLARRLQEQATRNRIARGTPELAIALCFSWRDEPLATLLKQVLEGVRDALGRAVAIDPQLPLASRLNALADAVGGVLLIVLDQFEEYFLYHGAEDGPGTFAYEFPRLVNDEGLRVNFLIAIREDTLARLDRFKGHIPNLFDNYVRLEYLDLKAARQAVEEPLARFNRNFPDRAVRLEDGFTDVVLKQTTSGGVGVGRLGAGTVSSRGDDSDTSGHVETPYLQMVLERVWDAEQRAGSHELRTHTITDTLGGAEKIVRTHLDHSLAQFDSEELDALAEMFRYLVTPTGSKIALTVRDLAEFCKLPDRMVADLLMRLGGNARILRGMPIPDDPETSRYEIFHDVLGPAVAEWRRRRDQVRETEAVRRQLRRTRALVGVFVVLFIAMVGLAGWAFRERRRSEGALQVAKIERGNTQAALDQVIKRLQIQLASPDGGLVVSALDQLSDGRGVDNALKLIKDASLKSNEWVASVALALDEIVGREPGRERSDWARKVRAGLARGLSEARAIDRPPSLEIDERLNPRIRIVGGSFQMGSPNGVGDDERPQHRVTVSAFRMQEHEVTNEEYRHFDPGHDQGARDDLPVVNVSWFEAMAYAAWLGGSLPTEAQWEFAARGKAGREYPWGKEPNPTCARANFDDCGFALRPVKAGREGGKTPEGVYDLAGNVWEWCRDWYGNYSGEEQKDPIGPASGSARVVRGGSFNDLPGFVRGAFRYKDLPGDRDESFGLRVVWSSAGGLD
jgi:hypothetical protein